MNFLGYKLMFKGELCSKEMGCGVGELRLWLFYRNGKEYTVLDALLKIL